MPHKDSKGRKVIHRQNLPQYPVTQGGGEKKRPSLGSGGAEKTAQRIESRQAKQDRAIRRMAQGKPPK